MRRVIVIGLLVFAINLFGLISIDYSQYDAIGDTIVFDHTNGVKDSLETAYIHPSAATTNFGTSDFIYWGHATPTVHTIRTMIRLNCTDVLSDTAELDSIGILVDMQNEYFNGAFFVESTITSYFLITGADSAWTETGVTWNTIDGSTSWDTAGVGLGNDAEATRTKVFLDVSASDSSREWYCTGFDTPSPNETYRDVKGFSSGDISPGSERFIWLPLQEIKEAIMGHNRSWVMYTVRHVESPNDSACGIRWYSEDRNIGGQIARVHFFYTPASSALPSRRRRMLIQNFGAKDEGVEERWLASEDVSYFTDNVTRPYPLVGDDWVSHMANVYNGVTQ